MLFRSHTITNKQKTYFGAFAVSSCVCVSADTSVTIVSCSVAAVLSVCAGDGDSEEVCSAAGAPDHAAIDIAITTASIPFIILLILIIVSPL